MSLQREHVKRFSGRKPSLLEPLDCRKLELSTFLKESPRVDERVADSCLIEWAVLCSLGCIPLPWFWCGRKRKDNYVGMGLEGVSGVRT